MNVTLLMSVAKSEMPSAHEGIERRATK